jgi:Ca2+-binding EF-hand superfamily protein
LPSPTNTPSIPGTPAPVDPALLALQRRDLNRNGKINIVELRLWLGSKADLKAWDQNGDQELDRQEFQAFFEANPTP